MSLHFGRLTVPVYIGVFRFIVSISSDLRTFRYLCIRHSTDIYLYLTLSVTLVSDTNVT